jgi:hypothetical protein
MLSKLDNSWVSVLSFEGPLRCFTQTAGPLTKLTRKILRLEGWTPSRRRQKGLCTVTKQTEFKTLPDPVDFDREFILTVDSSSIGIGAILSQLNNKGTEHPCAYASRVLTQAKASYSPCH